METSTNKIQFNLDSELKQGVHYYNLGKLEESWNVLSKINYIYPNHAYTLNLLGLIAYQQGKNQIATDLICMALKNNLNNPFLFNSLGLAFKQQGRINDAISCYQRALQLKHDYTNAYINLGLSFNDLERYDEAIYYFKRALSIDQVNKKGYYSLGVAYKETNKLEDAIACYKKFIELEPNDLIGQQNLGLLFLLKGNLFTELLMNFILGYFFLAKFKASGEISRPVTCPNDDNLLVNPPVPQPVSRI